MTQGEWALVGIIGWIWLWGVLEYFSISQEWLVVMTVMLLLDFIFGIISARMRWEEITSKKWGGWLVKKFMRWLLPFIVAGGLSRTWMWWMDLLIDSILWMIVFSELYSIIGHIYSINYNEELPETDAFKMLLNWLAKLVKSLINKTDSEINKEDKPLNNKGE